MQDEETVKKLFSYDKKKIEEVGSLFVKQLGDEEIVLQSDLLLQWCYFRSFQLQTNAQLQTLVLRMVIYFYF